MTKESTPDSTTQHVTVEGGTDQENCSGDPSSCKIDPAECSANTSLSGGSGIGMDDCLGRSLDDLSKTFIASARRWEMIVYPIMFAFILLSIYGFFLIFSLTRDASIVVEHVDLMAKDMHQITRHMNAMSQNMVLMTQTVDNQSVTMSDMAVNIRGMNMSMNQMRYDMSIMNQSVSRPMSFMNSFMPW